MGVDAISHTPTPSRKPGRIHHFHMGVGIYQIRKILKINKVLTYHIVGKERRPELPNLVRIFLIISKYGNIT